jgi:Zn-dependent M28 family amino/carboxypeptidase
VNKHWRIARGAVWGIATLAVVLTTVVMGARQAQQPADSVAARSAWMLAHVKTLSSDLFEGRAPGTRGEDLTVAYLSDQFKKLGLEPGNPDGTFVQTVPLMAFSGTPTASFSVKGQRFDLAFPDDYVAVSRQGKADVAVKDSEMVFVGYGVVAPEFGWDDFKGIDVRGKTIVMLVGDPPVPDPAHPGALDPATFKGRAMTYYGRWTYKYEIAAAKGAAAAIIVHETEAAAYPYSVVKVMGGENYGEASGDLARTHVPIDAWIRLDRAQQLFAAGGLDYAALKARAATREFTPVPMGGTASFTLHNTIRTLTSRNVIAKLRGSDPTLRHEYVMYSAHWDHFGRNASLPGDQILNGALDNGSGMAEMLAIAKALTQMSPRPKRSILFLSPTAEEAGTLGAKYYATHPLYPLASTLADINMDIMNFWGPTKAIVSIALGMSDLDEVIAAEAAKQHRIVLADPESEKGYFYRSDHFELAKFGVPALHFLHPGAEYRNQPPDYGQRKRDQYTTDGYHMVSDEVKPDWDLRGAVEDVDLLAAVGAAVANGDRFPEWKPGTEFKAIRERSLKEARPR